MNKWWRLSVLPNSSVKFWLRLFVPCFSHFFARCAASNSKIASPDSKIHYPKFNELLVQNTQGGWPVKTAATGKAGSSESEKQAKSGLFCPKWEQANPVTGERVYDRSVRATVDTLFVFARMCRVSSIRSRRHISCLTVCLFLSVAAGRSIRKT